MSLPDYETLMRPVLQAYSEGVEVHIRDIRQTVARRLELSDDQLKEMLPSGSMTVFQSRVGWAKSYLLQAGLLSSQRRGWARITERGQLALKECRERIDNSYLERFEEFQQFRERNRPHPSKTESSVGAASESVTPPEEQLEASYQALRDRLVEDILEAVFKCSDEFFERLVIEVLLAMGYGGARRDAGLRLGRSGDGGIDGTIKEDRLGLDVIYLQAKRWTKNVGSPEMRNFVGALSTNNARKGVFLTTSDFVKEARETAERAATHRIVLLTGREIANLMIDFNVGVSTVTRYEIKRLDSDFFSEE